MNIKTIFALMNYAQSQSPRSHIQSSHTDPKKGELKTQKSNFHTKCETCCENYSPDLNLTF